MKRVILDCDGVIIDFVKGYLELLNKHGGTSFVHGDISDWDIVECLGVPGHVQELANAEVVHDFCRYLDPIRGAPAGVRELMKHADVLFLTSPWVGCHGWTNAREAWLKEYCGVKASQVMHGSAKDWVAADIFVDDKASTVVKWAKAHPGATAVMWDQPWNRLTPPGDYVRTNSWSELLEMVK